MIRRGGNVFTRLISSLMQLMLTKGEVRTRLIRSLAQLIVPTKLITKATTRLISDMQIIIAKTAKSANKLTVRMEVQGVISVSVYTSSGTLANVSALIASRVCSNATSNSSPLFQPNET